MTDPVADAGSKIGEIVAAIITLAVLAVVVSNAANTANVLTAFFNGVTGLISTAISPITGSSSTSAISNALTSAVPNFFNSGFNTTSY